MQQGRALGGKCILSLLQGAVLILELVANLDQRVHSLFQSFEFMLKLDMCIVSHGVNIEPGPKRINCPTGLPRGAWSECGHPWDHSIARNGVLLAEMKGSRMDRRLEHDEIDAALRRCGATWNASQAHGFLCSRLAVRGTGARTEWLDQLAAGMEPANALQRECATILGSLFDTTWRLLAERQSEFMPLLPEDARPAPERADALAHWCEGFLHGLVSGPHSESLRTRLATEPLSDIIKDMLEIARATAEDSDDEESTEEAYVELVEYIRVAAQLAYEELAGFRSQGPAEPDADTVH